MYISGEQGGKVARQAGLRGTQAFRASELGSQGGEGAAEVLYF